jgi:hypothetical protein
VALEDSYDFRNFLRHHLPMTNPPPHETDQIARAIQELHDKTWRNNARARARRRKSPWNLLLFLLMLASWGALCFLLAWLGAALHAALHPAQAPLFLSHGPNRPGPILVVLASFFGPICPCFLLANWIVRALPPARRVLDAEARTVPGASYAESRRSLLKAGAWILAVCAPLWLIGAALA